MNTTVDIVFPVKGEKLEWDHSYALFGALCRIQPLLHSEGYPVGVFPINGLAAGKRTLQLTAKSALRLRVPVEMVGDAMAFLGSQLELDGHRVRLGNPEVQPIKSAPRLFSPWVTVRDGLDEETFLQRIGAELESLNIESAFGLARPLHNDSKDGGKGSGSSYIRRTRAIKGQSIVGFAVVVENLSHEDSFRLAATGLGGRRHFGGGLFMPARNR